MKTVTHNYNLSYFVGLVVGALLAYGVLQIIVSIEILKDICIVLSMIAFIYLGDITGKEASKNRYWEKDGLIGGSMGIIIAVIIMVIIAMIPSLHTLAKYSLAYLFIAFSSLISASYAQKYFLQITEDQSGGE